jgi:hypothetical protein
MGRGGEAGGATRRLELGPLIGLPLLVSGLPLGDLAPGTRLRIGGKVTVELGGAAAWPDGIVEAGSTSVVAARVLDAGTVAVGDPVAVEAVVLSLEPMLDLHTFPPDEIEAVVATYLAEARSLGLSEVRIVHGRGHGVQRATVRGVLARTPGVAGFGDAPPERGGWGATVVRLRLDGGPGSR